MAAQDRHLLGARGVPDASGRRDAVTMREPSELKAAEFIISGVI
jgi:hypothetical protein